MSRQNIRRQLDAGGLVAVDAPCDAKLTERIVARTYGSPALGDRVVVRLSADRLVPAEDLAMEFLGLEGWETSPPLARQNRTALDFAHWALINQPEEARYALDLVKRMKAAARRASSKPGHAWDLYAEMADELNKSVRHFLPPFWEQAARSFKDLGNATYAGRALNKALEAERVHALEVDREHRRDAVLEFSLSGCLSGKALTDYSKDLANQFEPAEAYETYKDLVIRRTMGGMPPAANAASDLIRMAKAADLDVDQEVESVLESIIASPAMSRAPMQFWKSVRKHVARVVARSDAFGVWLLAHTDPQPRYTDDSLVWQWLDLLEEWNVLPLLSKPADELPKEVEIPGGRAGWFSRLACVEESPDKRVFELLEQMAGVLRDEGQPLRLSPSSGWRGFIEVDILEACLQLGLEVATPPAQAELNFAGWLRETVDHPRRNSSLAHVANDPRFAGRLREKIPELISFGGDRTVSRSSWSRQFAPRRTFEEAAAGHPAIREAWWEYLNRLLESLETGGLVDFEQAIESLRGCARRKTVEKFPDFLPRLKAADPVACLQRTLAAGVFDEYGWEALDRAADERPVPDPNPRRGELLHWTFPRFVYYQNDRVHVVDPESNTPPREVNLTAQQQLQVLLPVGDDLLVAYRDNGRNWKHFIRWLSEPKKEYEQHESYYMWHVEAIVPVDDTAWFYGERAIQPGDTQLRDAVRHWFCDGKRFWRMKENTRYYWMDADEDDRPSGSPVSEIDPASGEELRDSVPPFFEADLPAGGRVMWHHSYLLPLPEQAGVSPLGSRDGLVGWRVVRRRDGAMESVGVDGRRVVLEADAQPASGFVSAIGLMDKPASDGSWMVTSDGRLLDAETLVAFAQVDNKRTKYFAGQPAELPTRFYHLMRVRCGASSKKLRATSRKQSEALLEAGRREHEARKEKEDPQKPNPERNAAGSAVAKWLPKAPPRLVAGVARIARVAAEEQIALNNLLQRFEPKEEQPTGKRSAAEPAADAARASAGLAQLDLSPFPGIPLYRYRDGQCDNAAHLMAVGRFFSGKPWDESAACDSVWFDLLRDPAAVAWRCFWKTATNVDLGASVASRIQSPWLDALLCLAESQLLDLPGSYKIYHIEASDDDKKQRGLVRRTSSDHPIAFVEGRSRYVAYRFYGFPHDRVVVLEYAANGKHKPPKTMAVEDTYALNPWWKARDVRSFVKAATELEELPLPTPEALQSAADELGVHPIAAALTFMGDLRTVHHGQEKLTKELRTHYGWKVKDIQLAIAQLEGIDRPESVGCVYARPQPSGALRKPHIAFREMVKAWKENRDDVVQLPAELAKDLERALGGYRQLSVKAFAETISNPKQCDVLTRRTAKLARHKRSLHYRPIEIAYSPPALFDPESVFPDLITAIVLVNYKLPVGDPVRQKLPALIDEVRSFLDDPKTQLPFGKSMTSADDIQNIDLEATVARFATQIGPVEQDEDGLYRGDDGSVSVALAPPHVGMLFRTAKLDGDAALARLRALAGLTTDWAGPGTDAVACAAFVLNMRSEVMSELREDNRLPALAEGSWEQDPRASTPALVAEAAQQLAVSDDAAALYLQTLALADPTALNVRKWNGWSPKQYKRAAAELVEGEHLVAAKRARAGREYFLPGGWEALGLPNLPIESWKLPLFGYDSTDRLRGGGAELIVCGRPIRRQFEAAWERVQQGDPPKYAEATTKRKRR